MLLKEPEKTIYAFSVTNTAITLEGEINDASSIQYTKKFNGYGTLTLYCKLSDDNITNCAVGNMIMIGHDGRYCYIITAIEPTKDEVDFVKIKVTGRSLEFLLDYRCIYDTDKYDNDHISTIMYSMVNTNFINPDKSNRVLPHLVCTTDTQFGEVVTMQRTGKTVLTRLQEISEAYDVGFEVTFDISALVFMFTAKQHTDRSINQNVNDPVVFDTDTDDILESDYLYDVSNEKNYGKVMGENQLYSQSSSGTTITVRANVEIGNDNLAGYQRKEIYIDARDLQSESEEDDDGQVTTMSEAEYLELLYTRGNEKLAENAIVESFEAGIRTYLSQYEYDVDYFVGDKITYCDRIMGVQSDAYITEVEQTFSDTYELKFTIGVERPTLYSQIKRMI